MRADPNTLRGLAAADAPRPRVSPEARERARRWLARLLERGSRTNGLVRTDSKAR
jgi:hypothetical protein